MAETVTDEGGGGRTIIYNRGEDEAHLSRQGILTAQAGHALDLLREVNDGAREVLKAISDVRDAVREDGEKTRLQASAIAREELTRKLAEAHAELLWYRKEPKP